MKSENTGRADSGVVRIGVLGAARIAGKALIAPAREVPSATVAAVATREASRAEAFALEHGIPSSYGAYDQLLDDPSVDAVYIPLPNALHGAWTLRALEAGKHVLCEKPFAANASEAAEVAAAAASSGLVVMEAMHYRYHPLVRRMSSLIADGAIGTPRHVQAWTCWPITSATDIRYLPDMAPGALMDGGCYAIDCLRLLGVTDPEVTGALADPVPGTSVDRALAARLTSPSGLTGWLESAFTGAGRFRADVHVAGDDGHLWLRNFINAQEGTLTVSPLSSSSSSSSSGSGSAGASASGPRSWEGADESPEATFTWQLRAFTAAVLRGEPFPTTADSAAATLRVIDDAYRAAGLPVREPVAS